MPADGRDVPSVRISLQLIVTASDHDARLHLIVIASDARCLHGHSSLKQRTHFCAFPERCLHIILPLSAHTLPSRRLNLQSQSQHTTLHSRAVCCRTTQTVADDIVADTHTYCAC